MSNARQLFVAAALASAATAKTTEEWKQRSVYQLLTDRFYKTDGDLSACQDLHNYCGGTFDGITAKLDYIAGMGFDAIWISPIPHNAEPDYHGYGALDWERVNEHFGSEEDLHTLVEAAHARDMWVMLDVVANHSTYYIDPDFSNVNPLDKPEYYHSKCDIDWDNQYTVENCWLAGLSDLDQSNDYVRSYLKQWISTVVQKFDFDGIRIDTIPEVPKDFWSEYTAASGVFQMGEVFNGDVGYVADYQHHVTALFNYPMFFTLHDVFGSGHSMYGIRSQYEAEDSAFVDVDALGSFMDNHDNARWLCDFPGNQPGFMNAVTFAMTARGIPFFYYGDEQMFSGCNDPANRESLWNDMDTSSEIYQYVAKINGARKAAAIWDHPYVERYVTDNFFAFSKGDMLVMTTNHWDTVDIDMPYLPYADGTVVCNIFWPDVDCETVSNGTMHAHLQNGEAKIWLPKSSSYFTNTFTQ